MAYTRIEHAGGAPETTVPGSLTAVATTIAVTDGTSWPTGATGPFYAVLDLGTDSEEKVKITSRTGNNLNGVTRGADGSTATTHDPGATLAHCFTATEADEANVATVHTVGRVTAAGDLLVADGANSLARLGKGANDTVLRVLAGAVGWGTLPIDSVGTSQIATDAVGPAEIAANAVGTSELADNAVDSAAIAANAVVSSKIATDAVGTTQIAPDAVGSSEIAADAVGASELADNAVDTNAIANLAVTAAKIAADTITAAQIAPDAIGSSELANNAVDTAAIADASVTPAKMSNRAANTVLEGPTGGGVPTETGRGRSWGRRITSSSGNVPDATPTKVNTLSITNVALKGGRRYTMAFSGVMATSAGSGNAFVSIYRNGARVGHTRSATIGVGGSGCPLMMMFEPGSDETFDWDIYISGDGATVLIEATPTEPASFVITDIGLASNT